MKKSLNKLKKVRRKRISWFDVLIKLKNPDMEKYFHELFTRFYDRKRSCHLSANRCAYYTLKNYYSTTTIDELCEVLGL